MIRRWRYTLAGLIGSRWKIDPIGRKRVEIDWLATEISIDRGKVAEN